MGIRQLLLMLCWTFVASGCISSKWAMDHADYRKMYDRPYPKDHLEKWCRMAKQMIDARHVANDSGMYLGGAASNFRDNRAVGAEVGVTNYSQPWLSSKMTLAGQLNSGAGNGFVGANTAVHVSTPTRIAPFVGAGLFGGVDISTVVNSLNDEESTDTQFLGAAYPEAGVHVWLNGRTRLTGSASYWVTTTGRDKDFWYYGLGLTFGFGPEKRTIDTAGMAREDEYVNRLLDGRNALHGETEAELEPSSTSDEEPTNHNDVGVPESSSGFDRAWPQSLILPPPPQGRLLPSR